MSRRLYPIGIQSFEKIRQDGYLYVDKTELLYRLVSTGSYYFLSRPRRFGKSLLLSTLEAYFQGKRHLFKGLAIEKLETDWIEYPVLHLDLNSERFSTPDSLESILRRYLNQMEDIWGKDEREVTISDRFTGIIRRAHSKSGKRVVILVDEYDKPLLQAVGDEKLQDEYRSTLKAFYGVLKTMDSYIQFAMLTGVTKFGKVSVFSDLNNLIDISMDEAYLSICGITENEIHQYMNEDILALGTALGISYDKVCEELKSRYDGYHFIPYSDGIYNPFSLFNTFYKKAFGNYWYETGTPSYLVQLLKRNKSNLHSIANSVTTASVLNSIDASSNNPLPVIYQSGYLTIKDYDPEFGLYYLGFPNSEVEKGFMNFLLPYYSSIQETDSMFAISQFVSEIRNGDPESFLNRLRGFFSDIPYELLPRDLEVHYQNLLYIVFKLVGFYVNAEYHTSNGRIDLLLQTERYIYIMEFKLNGSAEEAIRQIEEKSYAAPFAADPRKLFKIGINFSSTTRTIDRWLID